MSDINFNLTVEDPITANFTVQGGTTSGPNQPYILFTAPTTANGQTFTSNSLGIFTNQNYAIVFKNGVALPPNEYTISGNTLTVNVFLDNGDNVSVAPTGGYTAGGGGGGGSGTVTSVSGTGSALGFSLGGTVTTNGSLTLTGPNVAQLRTTLGVGNVANLNLNGNAQQYLRGDGTYANIAVPTVGNIATLNLSGNGNTYLNGVGSWVGIAPASGPSRPALVEYTFTGNTANTVLSDELWNFQFSANFSASGSGFSSAASSMPRTAEWSNPVYGNGIWVAGSWNNSGIATSTDGINWTDRTIASGTWTCVAFGNGIFVAMNYNSAQCATSPDGINWTLRSVAGGASNWTSITFGNGRFVAITGRLFGGNASATSTDGITWTTGTLPTTTRWTGIAYGNGTFVAVAGGTVPGTIAATSTDGVTWTQRTLSSSRGWSAITRADYQVNNGVFVAVAGDANVASISLDGITWNDTPLPAGITPQTIGFSDISGQKTLVAVTAAGRVITSTNTYDNWIEQTQLTGATRVSGIGFGDNYLVATSGAFYSGGSLDVYKIQTAAGTAYNLTLPAHGSYNQQTLQWLADVSGGQTPSTQASSLGNAITTLRNTYTASYPSAGLVVIDTNSGGNIGDVSIQTAITPAAGNVTLSITQGGSNISVTDTITFTDPQNSQQYTISPATATPRGNIANEIAVAETLDNWTFYIKGVGSANTKLVAEAVSSGAIVTGNLPTVAVVNAPGSTLAISRSVITNGQ